MWKLCLVAVVLWGALGVSTVSAFDPPNVPNWPGVVPSGSPMTIKVGNTGVLTWSAVDTYGWPQWETIVGDSLNSGSPDANSYGNAINRFLASEGRGQLVIRKALPGELPDITHHAVPTAFLEAKCGTWATACVYLLNPLTVPADHKAAAMSTWGYTSVAKVVRHENHHPVAQACDQYRGGCPRVSDGGYEANVVCTGNPDTLMDCGGAADTVMAFDYRTFKSAYRPTTGFLQVVPPCGLVGDVVQWSPTVSAQWDTCTEQWIGSNGWKYSVKYVEWRDPDNRLFWALPQSWGGWMCVPCKEDNGVSGWMPSGHQIYLYGRWNTTP